MTKPIITILSRNVLESFQLSSQRTLLIAIRDVGSEKPAMSLSPMARVDLEFDDISYESDIDRTFDLTLASKVTTELRSSSAIEHIIVSCEMGVSRSAGLAAALDEHFNARESDLFYDPKYEPNRLVYEIMKAALNDIK